MNIAHHLPLQARQRPDQAAVIAIAGRHADGSFRYAQLSFAELDRESDQYAWGLSAHGLQRGTRVLLMVRAGLPLISLTFALFKIGCVPILIDPAMGRSNLAQCIEECAPEAMVGVPRAHIARLLFPRAFATVRRSVIVDGPALPGTPRLEDLRAQIGAPYPLAQFERGETAAILFTTGSTGVPKGVVYEHSMFEAQVRMLRELFAIEPGEIEMPALPVFALFNVALGCTSAIPPIDPTRPASCDPAEVIAFMRDVQVTSTFGSPAIWNKLSRYAVEQQITLPHVRRVLMAGAPVPLAIHERLSQILSAPADGQTPYGATEALPVASISGREVRAAHAERNDPLAGTCVGRAVPGVELAIIPISDTAIEQWSDDLRLPPGEVGEIVVAGEAVTQTYLNRPESTKLAKIADGARVRHRMGDVGYLDEQGRLWFYGRKGHRVQTRETTFFTEPCELVFNQHPAVFRSALVGASKRAKRSRELPGLTGRAAPQPVIIIEPQPGKMPRTPAEREQFVAELRELGARYAMTAPITTFLFHPAFPVDIRHNAKIFREKLALWAEEHL